MPTRIHQAMHDTMGGLWASGFRTIHRALGRIIEGVDYVWVNRGGAPAGSVIPLPTDLAETAMASSVCEAVCLKDIPILDITRMTREQVGTVPAAR